MTDDRKFATAKIDKPMNQAGEVVPLTVSPHYKTTSIRKKHNPRNILYIFYIPLLFIDWVVTLLANITELLSNSIKELALHLESYINNGQKPNLPKSDSEDE